MFQFIDELIIKFLKKIWEPFSRISIFIIFLNFGLLKVLNLSPASPLVEALLNKTLPLIALEGQYIIKNLAIISLALVMGAHLRKFE
jgi:uncharacterized membrane protein YkgB